MRVIRATLLCGLALIWVSIAACGTAPGGKAGRGPSLLVVGATGGTGVELVRQALAKGYSVRALVRDEVKARELLGDQVDYFVGNVRDPRTLVAAFRGARFVVSALGSNSQRDPENKPELIDFGGVKALAEEARRAGVEHFVLVSSMGVTDPHHELNALLDDLMIWKLRGENALRASGVAYTIVRPAGLSNEIAGQVGVRLLQGDRREYQGVVARADVAAACVAALGRKNAFGKTFEMIGEGAPAAMDWDARFGALSADPKLISQDGGSGQ